MNEVAKEEENALASGGISSLLRIQGMGPNPREKAAMKTMRLAKGRKPTLSTVLLATNTSTPAVVVVEARVVITVVVSSHSSQVSYRVKKTATPTMEMQMNKSEMIKRILLPNLSMTRAVANVPTTWIPPINIALTQESRVVPAL